jgi:hypothetical protein
MKIISALVLAGTLWACAAPGAADVPAKGPAPVSKDTCGAAQYQWLVGKPKAAIPAAPAGAVWRIYSTEQVVTMDYVEARMAIVWDAKTGLVVRVKCG